MTGDVILVSHANRLSRTTRRLAKLVKVPGNPTAPLSVLPTKLMVVPGKSVTRPTPPLATRRPTPTAPLVAPRVPLTPTMLYETSEEYQSHKKEFVRRVAG
jgi:hypothetical protein